MTIKEAKELKLEAELAIQNILTILISDTGLKLTKVDVVTDELYENVHTEVTKVQDVILGLEIR